MLKKLKFSAARDVYQVKQVNAVLAAWHLRSKYVLMTAYAAGDKNNMDNWVSAKQSFTINT